MEAANIRILLTSSTIFELITNSIIVLILLKLETIFFVLVQHYAAGGLITNGKLIIKGSTRHLQKMLRIETTTSA